jgi:hypothetical protein
MDAGAARINDSPVLRRPSQAVEDILVSLALSCHVALAADQHLLGKVV